MKTAPIIIIDDDEEDCELILEAFANSNVVNEIIIINDTQKAFEYLEVLTKQPFFILCDVNMPKLNGLQLRKKINEKEELRLKAIPFLFWSTSGSEMLVKQAYSLNIQGFFKKPDDTQKLKDMIVTIMEYWNCSDHPLT